MSTNDAGVVFATPKQTLEHLAQGHRDEAQRYRDQAGEHEDAARRAWARAHQAEANALAFADAAAKLEGGQ